MKTTSPTPVRDEALLRKVADAISAYPESYSQMTFMSSCGTKMCIAGHAAMIADPDCSHQMIAIVGRRALGLTQYEAMILFDPNWRPVRSAPSLIVGRFRRRPIIEDVADALYRLADGAPIEEVTEYSEYLPPSFLSPS